MKLHPLVLGVLTLTAVNLRADQPASATPAPAPATTETTPVAHAPITPAVHPEPRPFNNGSPFRLTPEEAKILGQAHIELQKDPELIDLTNQIKALMEKREKLTEEKVAKLSPEAAAIFAKLKEQQEKMMAERKAQIEAMQAKAKAPQAVSKVPAEKPAFTPAPPITVTPTAPSS